jgi:Leucine-rich repeat (LRR) protein
MKNEVREFCRRFNITENQFYGREEIKGSLYLYSNQLTTLPDGFNPTVGGSLDLSNNQLTTLPDGFNPTVGGSLDLSNNQLTTLPDGFNPTVGGSLDLSNNQRQLSAIKRPYVAKPFVWQDGKYIMVDGLFTEVVRKRGNVYIVKKINAAKEFYLVTDGDGTWSHGDTLKQAKEDLIFKALSEKMKNEPLSMISIVDVPRYRAITGACSTGVQMFRDQHGLTKDSYTVAELLPILEKNNAYGISRFKELVRN